MRALTPLFGGLIADEGDVVLQVARALEVALDWHAERECAAQLLEVPSVGVRQVARAVGYPRASSFVAAFEREYGISTGAWRAEQGAGERGKAPQGFDRRPG